MASIRTYAVRPSQKITAKAARNRTDAEAAQLIRPSLKSFELTNASLDGRQRRYKQRARRSRGALRRHINDGESTGKRKPCLRRGDHNRTSKRDRARVVWALWRHHDSGDLRGRGRIGTRVGIRPRVTPPHGYGKCVDLRALQWRAIDRTASHNTIELRRNDASLMKDAQAW